MKIKIYLLFICFYTLSYTNTEAQDTYKLELAIGGALEAVKTSQYYSHYNNHHNRKYSDVSEIRILNTNPEVSLYLNVNDLIGIKLAVNSSELFEETGYSINPNLAFYGIENLGVDKSNLAFGVAFDRQKYYSKLGDKTNIGSQIGIGAFIGIHGKRLKTEVNYSYYAEPQKSSCYLCTYRAKHSNHSFTFRMNYTILNFKNN